MLLDLARALPAALAAVVLPGYFWAAFLRPTRGLGERLAYATALSMALVPLVALVLARLAGSGVTLWVALASAAIVFGAGAAAVRLRGPARTSADPVLPRPPVIRDVRVLALTAAGLALAVASGVDRALPGWVLVLVAVTLLTAGGLAARVGGRAADAAPAADGARGGPAQTAGRPGASPSSLAAGADSAGPATATSTRLTAAGRPPAAGARPPGPPAAALPDYLRAPALAIVLGLTAFRAYIGVVRHDWPFIRGGDSFSHAVMAEQIMAHGSYGSYLIYPPGFSTLTAVVSRLSGLPPLSVFPVLAPALLVVVALAAYALATRLWGWEYGVAAAALSGLVLVGAYAGFAGGRYPDLVGAYFLVPMAVAALIGFYQAPTARSGALLTVVGAAVVLYHSVATLYLALLIALAGLAALAYLLAKGRRSQARALLLAFAALGVLSACYALYTYGFQLLGGRSATAKAVSIALGSQPTPAPAHLLAELAPTLVWLGALGVAMLATGARRLRGDAQSLTVITLLLWCVMMYLGSRTAADGFPQRFERDLGAPLSVIGALALGAVLMSALRWRSAERSPVVLAAAAAGAVVVLAGMQAAANVKASARPGSGVLSRPVAAAGAWLARHNTGTGTIISTPYMNPGVSNRAVLAMGGYTGLQSYEPFRIAHPRSLPTAGKQPLLDSQNVLLHPATCQAADILARDDVQYVILYTIGAGADLAGFQADTARYHLVFGNSRVVIYRPSHAPCPG